MNQPHDNWSKYYDFVYQNALGDFYDNITDETLNRNIVAIYNQLKPDGYLFFDLLGLWFFKNKEIINVSSDGFSHREWLTQREENIYTYHQEGRGVLYESEFHFSDAFPIRYWELKTVNDIFIEIGFEEAQNTFPQLSSESSTYKLYKKL